MTREKDSATTGKCEHESDLFHWSEITVDLLTIAAAAAERCERILVTMQEREKERESGLMEPRVK